MSNKDFESFLFMLECKLQNIRSLVRSESEAEHYIDELRKIIIKKYEKIKR